MQLDQIDKSNLMREAYRIEGITDVECRSIFVDWALKLPAEIAPAAAIEFLLSIYEAGAEGHPMTDVLRQGLSAPARPKRRGGRSARVPE